MAQLLSDTEITAKLEQIPSWALYGQEIQLVRTFKNFVEAIAFVNQLVEPAERAGHHPDIAISYNKVTISLTTHDAGGLTKSDFELAAVISELN